MTTAVVQDKLNVLVYSDNRNVRDAVMRGVGRKVGKNGPEISWMESATGDGAMLKVREAFDAGERYELLILDAETKKFGGIGLGKMVRDEIDPDVKFIILIARPQDEWLARVAEPNAVLQYPVDGRALSAAVEQVLAEAVSA
ncbi:MAG: hypothetical protein GX483_06305 [Actinomycetaceae bacterium]|nr:hypothetical protein [Actinomycetaceae bacterium]